MAFVPALTLTIPAYRSGYHSRIYRCRASCWVIPRAIRQAQINGLEMAFLNAEEKPHCEKKSQRSNKNGWCKLHHHFSCKAQSRAMFGGFDAQLNNSITWIAWLAGTGFSPSPFTHHESPHSKPDNSQAPSTAFFDTFLTFHAGKYAITHIVAPSSCGRRSPFFRRSSCGSRPFSHNCLGIHARYTVLTQRLPHGTV